MRLGRTREVHRDQMKSHVADSISGETYPLGTHTGGMQALGVEPTEYTVQEIRRHRRGMQGEWEFLTLWEGYDPKDATWEPLSSFIHRYAAPWVEYCRQKGLYPETTRMLRTVADQ